MRMRGSCVLLQQLRQPWSQVPLQRWLDLGPAPEPPELPPLEPAVAVPQPEAQPWLQCVALRCLQRAEQSPPPPRATGLPLLAPGVALHGYKKVSLATCSCTQVSHTHTSSSQPASSAPKSSVAACSAASRTSTLCMASAAASRSGLGCSLSNVSNSDALESDRLIDAATPPVAAAVGAIAPPPSVALLCLLACASTRVTLASSSARAASERLMEASIRSSSAAKRRSSAEVGDRGTELSAPPSPLSSSMLPLLRLPESCSAAAALVAASRAAAVASGEGEIVRGRRCSEETRRCGGRLP